MPYDVNTHMDQARRVRLRSIANTFIRGDGNGDLAAESIVILNAEVQALRCTIGAVLDLHAPMGTGADGLLLCRACSSEDSHIHIHWPCPTLTAMGPQYATPAPPSH